MTPVRPPLLSGGHIGGGQPVDSSHYIDPIEASLGNVVRRNMDGDAAWRPAGDVCLGRPARGECTAKSPNSDRRRRSRFVENGIAGIIAPGPPQGEPSRRTIFCVRNATMTTYFNPRADRNRLL